MATEQASEFLGRLAEDAQLADRVRGAHVELLVRIASEAGYECTTEEMSWAMEEMSALMGELTDEELEVVAGGAVGASHDSTPGSN